MIFNVQELQGKEGPSLQQASTEIKQRFDHKRNFYHHLRNQYFVVNNWDELNQKIVEFDTKYASWTQEWKAIHRSGNINIQLLITLFEKGNSFYKEMDDYVSNLIPTHQDSLEIDVLKREVLQHIENDFVSLKADIASQIDKGINNVIGLKAELGLEKNFSENIESELMIATKFKNRFMFFFIASMISIPTLLGLTFKYDLLPSLEDVEINLLRLAAVVSFGFLSCFFFGQYRLYQMICLRYSHLRGFLGGGATFITQIIGTENNDVKKDVSKKLAELFMELDDIFGVVKKNKHPAEVSIDKLGKFIEQVGKLSSPKG